jgi:hypothetical protein
MISWIAMTQILPAGPHEGVHITATSELAHAARAVVCFGSAPDGLPWLLDVDRSHRLHNLFSAVVRAFDLVRVDDLPAGVRKALQDDVAAGLMGVHAVALAQGPGGSGGSGGASDASGSGGSGGASDASDAVYVSRRSAGALLGPSLLARMLDTEAAPRPRSGRDSDDEGGMAATSASALSTELADTAYVEAVEDAIRDRQARRHLILRLADGSAWIGSVRRPDRPLRTPSGPYRPMVFESLADLPGAQACLASARGETWRVPLTDQTAYASAILRVQQDRLGGRVTFELPRQSVLAVLIEVARMAGAVHARGTVHGDLTPGNVLITQGRPVSFDGLDLPIGSVATAATFRWAAPEQIIGRPLDPRADVHAVGRMVTHLLGGVAFGEETHYVVPTGGRKLERVQILKTDGVFIDILDSDHTRAWQLAWQGFLGRSLAHDPERRPADGNAMADALADLAERYPVAGTVEIPGSFGTHVRVDAGETWHYARRVVDEP